MLIETLLALESAGLSGNRRKALQWLLADTFARHCNLAGGKEGLNTELHHFAEDFKETVASALPSPPPTPGKALAAAKGFIEPRLSNEVRNLLRARGVAAHPVARGRCKRALEEVRVALSTPLGISSGAESPEVDRVGRPVDCSTQASRDDSITGDCLCSDISREEAADSGASDTLGEHDNASPEAFFFGDAPVDVASQTLLSLPDASSACICAASPHDALELALEWTAKDKLFEIRKCAGRVEELLGQDVYAYEPIETPKRPFLDPKPLDEDSVVLDCAMLKAALDRLAACAHHAESLTALRCEGMHDNEEENSCDDLPWAGEVPMVQKVLMTDVASKVFAVPQLEQKQAIMAPDAEDEEEESGSDGTELVVAEVEAQVEAFIAEFQRLHRLGAKPQMKRLIFDTALELDVPPKELIGILRA